MTGAEYGGLRDDVFKQTNMPSGERDEQVKTSNDNPLPRAIESEARLRQSATGHDIRHAGQTAAFAVYLDAEDAERNAKTVRILDVLQRYAVPHDSIQGVCTVEVNIGQLADESQTNAFNIQSEIGELARKGIVKRDGNALLLLSDKMSKMAKVGTATDFSEGRVQVDKSYTIVGFSDGSYYKTHIDSRARPIDGEYSQQDVTLRIGDTLEVRTGLGTNVLHNDTTVIHTVDGKPDSEHHITQLFGGVLVQELKTVE